MVEIRFSEDTSVAPQAVLAAAKDFSSRRPELWPNLDPGAYAVHAIGDTWAEANEGSAVLGGIWARERYDWSTPGTIRAEVQASNVFRPGSSWELNVRAGHGGGSSVEWVARREAHGLKGHVLVLMLRLAGRSMLSESLRQTLGLIESGKGGSDVRPG